MRRWLFNRLAAGSVVVLVAAGGMWGRSYWYEDRLSNAKYNARLTVDSNCGVLGFSWYTNRPPLDSVGWVTLATSEATEGISFSGNPHWSGWGVEAGRYEFVHWDTPLKIMTETAQHYLGVRYWAVCVLAAVMPAAWGVGWWRVRGRGKPGGYCEGCGYDLRASKARCPECGRAIVGQSE